MSSHLDRALATALLGVLLCGPAPSARAEVVKETVKRVDDGLITAGRITWLKDYEAALALAAREEKPVMIDFFTTWCGPCKMLDRETFGDADVIRFVQRFFVALKIDADKHPELREKHAVEGYPTVLFLSPSGGELNRILGFRKPKDFLAEAGKAARSSSALQRLEAEAKSHPDDVDAQRAWALALLAAGNDERAIEVLSACVKEHPESIHARLDLAGSLRTAKKLDEAAEQYEIALRRVATRPADELREETERARLALARTHLALKEPRRAETVLSAALAIAPRDDAAAKAARLEALFLRAYARALLREADGAVADLRRAEEVDPEGAWGYRASLIRDLVEEPATERR